MATPFKPRCLPECLATFQWATQTKVRPTGWLARTRVLLRSQPSRQQHDRSGCLPDCWAHKQVTCKRDPAGTRARTGQLTWQPRAVGSRMHARMPTTMTAAPQRHQFQYRSLRSLGHSARIASPDSRQLRPADGRAATAATNWPPGLTVRPARTPDGFQGRPVVFDRDAAGDSGCKIAQNSASLGSRWARGVS